MNINIQIERPILDGLSVTTSQGSAVQAELTRVLADHRLPDIDSGAVVQLSAGQLNLPERIGPVRLGGQIARTVYGSLGPQANIRGGL